jgi:DNA topoisomerase-3
MAQTVWICEKPKMGQALARALGERERANGSIATDNGTVTWAFGHLLGEKYPNEIDAKYEKWSIDDLPLTLDEIPLKSNESSVAQLRHIGALLKKADRVVIATDADRAGERIAREILEHYGFSGKIDRLMLRSPEISDVKDAVSEMRKDPRSAEKTHPWLYEERGRAFEDWHVGMNGSRAGTIKMRPLAFHASPWSVGGVQTPTLAMIVARDLDIENFQSRDFFTVGADVETARGKLALTHAPDARIFDKAMAEKIEAAAKAWQGALAVETKLENKMPYKLFGQTGLQKAAGSAFGWAPAKTLQVAQRLYESGHITYPRGDCEYIGTSSIPKIKVALEKLRNAPGFESLDAFLQRKETVMRFGSRYNDAKVQNSAHEAIVPTANVPNFAALASDERALYTLLAKNLAANHMEDGVDDTMSVKFSVEVDGKDRVFALAGRRVKHAGWREIFGKEDDAEKPMPEAANGDKGKVVAAQIETSQTQPPKRWALWDLPSVMARLEEYLEGADLEEAERKTLIAALQTDNPEEPRGLGTPATRASVIATLVDRAYVEVVDGKGKVLSADQVREALDSKTKKPNAKGGQEADAKSSDGKKGKKTALLVRATVNGRALIGAWKAVYPAIADPIERARMEEELTEIGRARDADAARKRFAQFRTRVHKDVREMVAAVRGAGRAEVTADQAASMRQVSKKQLDYAKKLAGWRKVKLPEDAAGNAALLSAWIDLNKPKEDETFVSKKQIELAKKIVEIMTLDDDVRKLAKDPARVLEIIESNPPEKWPASARQMAAVQAIAEQKNIELPQNWKDDRAFIGKFLEANARKNEDGSPASGAGAASEKSAKFAALIAEKLKLKFDASGKSQEEVSKFIEANKDKAFQGGGQRRDAPQSGSGSGKRNHGR